MYKFIVILALSMSVTVAERCGGPILSNLNPNVPKGTDILFTSEQGKDTSFCSYLTGKDVCCRKAVFDSYNTKFKNFYNEVDRRNFEVIYRYNDWMVSTLRNEDKIMRTVTALNDLADQINSGQTQVTDQVDQLQSDLNDEGQDSNLGRFNLSGIPLPSDYEKYRDGLERLQGSVNDQLDQSDEYRGQLANFTLFENSTFYSSYIDDQGRRIQRFDDDKVKRSFEQSQVRMRRLVNATSTCMPMLLAHYAGLRCLTCETGIEQVFTVNKDLGRIELNADLQTCSELRKACYDYVDVMQQLNQNIDLFVLSQVADKYTSNVDVDEEFSTEEAVALMITLQQAASETIKTVLYYDRPDNCTSADVCSYICNKWPTATTVDLNEVFGGRLYMSTYKSPNEISLNLTDLIEALRTDEDEAVTTESEPPKQTPTAGNEPQTSLNSGNRLLAMVQLPPDVTYHNKNSHRSRDTIAIGLLTEANLEYKGTSVINVFNLTGNATQADLDKYQVITDQNRVEMVEGMFAGILLISGLTIIML